MLRRPKYTLISSRRSKNLNHTSWAQLHLSNQPLYNLTVEYTLRNDQEYTEILKNLRLFFFFFLLDSVIDEYNAPQTKSTFKPMPFVRAGEAQRTTTVKQTPQETDNEDDEDDVIPFFDALFGTKANQDFAK